MQVETSLQIILFRSARRTGKNVNMRILILHLVVSLAPQQALERDVASGVTTFVEEAERGAAFNDSQCAESDQRRQFAVPSHRRRFPFSPPGGVSVNPAIFDAADSAFVNKNCTA